MADEQWQRIRISGEVWAFKLKSYLKSLIILSGFAVLLIGAYGMISTGTAPLIEAQSVPADLQTVKETALLIAETWYFSIPGGAAMTHFSLKL